MFSQMKRELSIIILLSILLLNVSVFAQITPEGQEGKEYDIGPTGKEGGHPKLEGILYRLIQAEDYKEFAQIYGITIIDNKVEVVVELVDTQYNLSSEFGEEESRLGNSVLALVYIDKLLDLADDQNIQFIRTRSPRVFEGDYGPTGETKSYIYYLGGVSVIIVLLLIYYFLKKKRK